MHILIHVWKQLVPNEKKRIYKMQWCHTITGDVKSQKKRLYHNINF